MCVVCLHPACTIKKKSKSPIHLTPNTLLRIRGLWAHAKASALRVGRPRVGIRFLDDLVGFLLLNRVRVHVLTAPLLTLSTHLAGAFYFCPFLSFLSLSLGAPWRRSRENSSLFCQSYSASCAFRVSSPLFEQSRSRAPKSGCGESCRIKKLWLCGP